MRLEWLWSLFTTLATHRTSDGSGGVNPIPALAMYELMELRGIPPVLWGDGVRLLSEMDAEVLSHYAAKAREEIKKSGGTPREKRSVVGRAGRVVEEA